ncbi:RagB/SusD family nutrient uptake outer membrane protein [Echinicola strongylocentroti]|uniref:RagB/SusD family nutrient uptake outer membrane protein n=1 Tax=Echinicola strongylocentroti TaxID=1795355 RepID=A0A2Z4IEL3_9BACT|nr:RagB/SusD family nutrient uptake outer membrane protein [Echinicola strongylocentroti]AWW29522.1 RagB/SusD family nutrient uptake outer membrane protein [Echinicola strongylocentroti]
MNIRINTKKIIGFALTSSLLFGCGQDFLEEVNPNAITTETFWKSPEQFQSGLTTAYAALQFQSISGTGLVYEMALGDIGGTESWYRPTAFRNLTYNDASIQVTDKWNELYIGIFRTNQVIGQVQTVDPSILGEEERLEIEAQARFLRAFFYFQLATTYGQGVLRTTVPDADEDFNKGLSTKEEIYSTVVLPDLEFAKAHLPEQWPESEKGRATWGAATALKGKSHLFQEEWDLAATEFKEVIDAGIYSLVPDYMDNFTHLNEHNEESIFETAYSAEVNPGANGNTVDDTPNTTGSEASGIATQFGQLNFGAYNTLLPSYYLHEIYVNDEVDPSNPINEGNIHSSRLSASIVPINGETDYYLLPIGERGGWAFGQSAYIKKYTNWYHLPNEDGNSRSGINFRHIRLADVYLMYAEAILQSTGDIDEAITYIDIVRSRAGVITLRTYLDENGNTFPQLHISKQVHGTQPWVSPNPATLLTHLRRVERPIELAFEGHRYKDLVRWGIVQDVFDELRADEIWREANKDGIFDQAPLYIQERIRPDFLLSSQNYNPSVHNYFPVPAGELQNNEALGQ